MERNQLQELKDASENRCKQLFEQINELTIELERTRGDFRTYENLLLNWRGESTMSFPEQVKPIYKEEIKKPLKAKGRSKVNA
jgi:hypothetical protein